MSGLRGGYGAIHSVIVNGYNVKFAKDSPYIISVSIPGVRCEIDLTDGERKLNDSFVTALEIRDWSPKAINNLQKYILSEDKWDSCIEMNTKTGKIMSC